ncbi:MAG: hypothetical protein ACFFER_07510 [Candidatus Thorarchaeota archaeon]
MRGSKTLSRIDSRLREYSRKGEMDLLELKRMFQSIEERLRIVNRHHPGQLAFSEYIMLLDIPLEDKERAIRIRNLVVHHRDGPGFGELEWLQTRLVPKVLSYQLKVPIYDERITFDDVMNSLKEELQPIDIEFERKFQLEDRTTIKVDGYIRTTIKEKERLKKREILVEISTRIGASQSPLVELSRLSQHMIRLGIRYGILITVGGAVHYLYDLVVSPRLYILVVGYDSLNKLREWIEAETKWFQNVSVSIDKVKSFWGRYKKDGEQ